MFWGFPSHTFVIYVLMWLYLKEASPDAVISVHCSWRVLKLSLCRFEVIVCIVSSKTTPQTAFIEVKMSTTFSWPHFWILSEQRIKVYVNSSTFETIMAGVCERESRLKNKSKLVSLLSFSVSRCESVLRQHTHTHTHTSKPLTGENQREGGCKIPLYRKLALPVNSPLTEIQWGFQGNRSTDLRLWAKLEMNSWFVGHTTIEVQGIIVQ